MDWMRLLDGGGAWVLALAIGWAVLTGRLRLDREVAKLESDYQTLRDEKAELQTKFDKAQDIMGRNTDALAQNATAQEAVVTMLRDLLGETSTNSTGTPRG